MRLVGLVAVARCGFRCRLLSRFSCGGRPFGSFANLAVRSRSWFCRALTAQWWHAGCLASWSVACSQLWRFVAHSGFLPFVCSVVCGILCAKLRHRFSLPAFVSAWALLAQYAFASLFRQLVNGQRPGSTRQLVNARQRLGSGPKYFLQTLPVSRGTLLCWPRGPRPHPQVPATS